MVDSAIVAHMRAGASGAYTGDEAPDESQVREVGRRGSRADGHRRHGGKGVHLLTGCIYVYHRM